MPAARKPHLAPGRATLRTSRIITVEKGRELTRDWVDRKKAAAFVAEYAHAGADIKKRNDEMQASLAAGEITMQSVMMDTARMAEGSL
jgi:hypothetical protein